MAIIYQMNTKLLKTNFVQQLILPNHSMIQYFIKNIVNIKLFC